MKWLTSLFKSTSSAAPKMEPVPISNPISIPDAHESVDIFLEALTFVLKKEGGYVNNPNDRGGPTNKGIIQREYDEYREDKKLPFQSVQYISDADVSDIYWKKYWNTGKCPAMPRKLAIIHFDTCVNCGVRQAGKFLQRAIKCPVDGIVGDKTIFALNEYLKTASETEIIHSYLSQRSEFYYGLVRKDSSQLVFIKGWQNRVQSLTKFVQLEDSEIV